MNRKISLPIILLLFNCMLSTAQTLSPNSKISFMSFDRVFFEELCLKKLNFVRDTIHVRQLSKDSVLSLASKHHAEYMMKNSKDVNNQEGEKLETVEDRVKSFNGIYSLLGQCFGTTYVGKSVLLKSENKKVIYETYEEAATGIIKNLIQNGKQLITFRNSEFSNLGIYVTVDTESKKIYLVTVLGNLPFTYPIGIKADPKNYGLKPAEAEECAECKKIIKNIPAHTQYGIKRVGMELFYYFSDLEYFNKLAEESFDAVAVDIIRRSQFQCDYPNTMNNATGSKGILLKPVKKKALIKANTKISENQVWAKIGVVPSVLDTSELEYNVVYIKGKNPCVYQEYTSFFSDTLNLLHTGLFIDTISPENQLYSTDNHTFKYTINYAPDQLYFSESELSGLFKAVRSFKYDFRSIDLLSYSQINANMAVEDSLSKIRIGNLINKINELQNDSIPYTVKSLKAWTQMYADLSKDAKLKDLYNLSREELEAKVKTNTSSTLTKYLLNGNKIHLYFKLEPKKDKIVKSFDQLKSEIQDALDKNDYKRVNDVQNTIFNSVYYNEIGDTILDSYLLPMKKELIQVLVNHAAFRYFRNPSKLDETFDVFGKLNDLNKGDVKILYNLTSLNFAKTLRDIDKIADVSYLEVDINKLVDYNLDKRLLKKLTTNLHLLRAEKYRKTNNSRKREDAVKTAITYCSTINLTDEDLTCVAQTFSHFGEHDFMDQMLLPYLIKDNCDDNLLFYFIKASVNDETLLKNPDFEFIVQNAISHDKARFCEIFNSKTESFQIMNHTALKAAKCKFCK